METLNEIVDILKDHNNVVKFDTYIRVKTTPHALEDRIISVWQFNNKVYCICNGKIKEANTKILINSIYQRIKLLQWKNKL